MTDPDHSSAGAWAKKYTAASRSVMESVLRPYDLGPTQWYVLYQLADVGPTNQRDLVRLLQVERATLSGVVAVLVRKNLIVQVPDLVDQRQKVLRLTDVGLELWRSLPDPIAVILSIAFADVAPTDIETIIRVLRIATERLNEFKTEGIKK